MHARQDSNRNPVRAESSVLSEMVVPTLDLLYAFTATIDSRDIRDPSARSDFHWQTFKCRLAIFSLPVLVCPVRLPGSPLRDFTVICRRTDLDEDVNVEEAGAAAQPQPSPLRAKLDSMKLVLSRLRPVSNAEYAACLEYTLAARMSPLWNPVAEYLVQGKDFLDESKLTDAVRLQVNVVGDKGSAWLSIYPSRLRIAPLAMSDMDVSSSALERFQDNPLGEVPATCIGSPWVHVLPSLKKGMVMSITKRIPAECPFQQHRDFRRHWKNMYGYRLPDAAAAQPYVSVFFELIGKPMCYPWPCLTPRHPVALQCLDPPAVAAAFLRAVAARMPTVCGLPSPVTLAGRRVEPVAALYPADGLADDAVLGQANLRTARPRQRCPPSPTPSPSYPSSCPLSIATQRDGTRPRVDWNLAKRAPPQEEAEEDEDKENRPPQEPRTATQPRPPLQRPVFRSRAPAPAARVAPSGAMTWFQPTATSSPPNADDGLNVAVEAGRPASPGLSSLARSPATSSRMSDRSSSPAHAVPQPHPEQAAGAVPKPPMVPTFRVPAHKPIFLPRFKLKPPSTPAAKGKAGRAPSQSPSSASGWSSAGPSKAAASGASGSRKSPAVKRASSEAMPVPELRTADACRRASLPVLLAWLRDKGVPCRAKDKKGELVDKAIAKVAELAR